MGAVNQRSCFCGEKVSNQTERGVFVLNALVLSVNLTLSQCGQ